MNKKSFCIANWKMNKNISESIDFFNQLDKFDFSLMNVNMIVCPSSIDLYTLSKLNLDIDLGCQNISNKEKGAFTGEISISMIEDIGCKWTIIGHSERRSIYNETNQIVQEKMQLTYNSSISPILCIGETIEERNNNKTYEVLEKQLFSAFNNIDFKRNKEILIAYEPVWAIGTGIAAAIDEIDSNIKIIKKIINSFDTNNCNLYLLYGGSVDPDNAAEIYKIKNISGFLIGTSSLEAEMFYNIYKQM